MKRRSENPIAVCAGSHAFLPRPRRRQELLLADIRELIAAARERTAQAVNTGLLALYWNIGRRIRQDVLKEKRAGYGERIVFALGRRLSREYGQGFDEKNIRRMIQFAAAFPDSRIVATLSRQLGWSHFVAILPLKDELQRDFYAEMRRTERWSVRTLRKKMQGMILCAGKRREQIELLELEKSGIRVAEYLTALPPRKLLAKRLHEAIRTARLRLADSLRERHEMEEKGCALPEVTE